MNRKNVFLLFILLLIPAIGWSQDVNGLKGGVKYTKKQVVAALGKPDNYSSHTSEFGLDEEYTYGNCYFRFGRDGVLEAFHVADRKFKVLTKWIENGVRVGDKVSVLDKLKFGALVPDKKNKNVYYIPIPSDDILTVTVENGIIKGFTYTLPF